MKNKLSVIIPSCREPFLQQTIDGILRSSKEEIEIIVYLDYYEPKEKLIHDKRVIVLKTPEKVGMRKCINLAANVANGDYLLKCDAHCLFDEGFDVKLKKNIELNWVSVPRRYLLNPKGWKRRKKRKYIDYLYITPPKVINGKPKGLDGKKWRGECGDNGSKLYLEEKRSDILIDDIMAFQGSCWFMHRSHFYNINGLDYINFGSSGRESLEISFKTLLSGGRVVRNKNTWYAHLMRGTKYAKPKEFSKDEYNKSVNYIFKLCFNDWPGKIMDFKEVIDKFMPLDHWPVDWFSKEDIEVFKNG